MSRRYAKHATEVVERFKELLSPSGRSHVGENHFSELAMLIESAITTSVLEEMEQAADQIDKLAHDLRSHAEHYEAPPGLAVD
jgi:predicted Co/Zn/Cd cation transporter (cation efflux family)